MPRRGPRTPEGKAVVSRNAIKHGLFSESPVIPGESEAHWLAFRDGILESLQPEGQLEQFLAEQVATNAWRIRRVQRFETSAVIAAQERIPEFYRLTANYEQRTPSVEDADRQLEAAARAIQLLRDLPDLPADDEVPEHDARSVLNVLSDFDPSHLPHTLTIDGEPVRLDDILLWDPALLRQVLDAVAAYLETTADELRAWAIARAERVLEDHREDRTRIERELEHMRARRSLPDPRTLESIIRAEANVTRRYYQALHELEAVQAKRRGQSTTVHRVDVHGIPGV